MPQKTFFFLAIWACGRFQLRSVISTVPRGLLSGGQGHPNSHRLCVVRGLQAKAFGVAAWPSPPSSGANMVRAPSCCAITRGWSHAASRGAADVLVLALVCWFRCWFRRRCVCVSERRWRWCVPGHLFFSVFKDVGAWAPWGFFVFSPPSSVRGHLVPWKLAPSWAWPWRAELRPLSRALRNSADV